MAWVRYGMRGGGASLLAALVLFAACSAPSGPPERSCAFTVWARSEGGAPAVTGSFDGWEKPGRSMSEYGEEDWYFLELSLPPGEHGYLITDASGTHPDRYNPQRTYHGETEVSLAVVADCNVPQVSVEAVQTTDEGAITVTGTFYASPNVDAKDRLLSDVKAEDAKGNALSVTEISPETGRFVLSGSDFARGKHTFRIEAKDGKGTVAEAPNTVAWIKPAAKRWEDGILYQVVVDRFLGDGGAPLPPPETPGHRAGGTLGGVLSAIESGYFEEMGVSALWLSPVYENPAEMLVGRDGHLYEGFHGYWVLRERGVEPKIGGEAALHAVIEAAHARGIAVLLDFVPNHLYEASERYQAHQADGWFNNGPTACVCGVDPGCDWGERLQDCWFAPYLPDVRWQSEGSRRETLEDLRFWMRTFDADGIRIDAVPMMPRLATRRMVDVLRSEYAPGRAMFSIGEVFTGPGDDGTAQIKYFLGPDGLDGAFDFPLTWSIRDVIASENGGFFDIDEAISRTEAEMAGSGSMMGLMVDNHDMPRFMTEAAGQGGANAWTSPATVPSASLPYQKLKMALSLVMTLPGLPVVYYGTEVGLVGGSDPDNRRVLTGVDALSEVEASVLAVTRRLGKLRACSDALKGGDRKPFLATKRTYGFSRSAPGDSAIVLLSTESETKDIVPPLKAVPKGLYTDAFTGEAFYVGEGEGDPVPVPMEPFSFRILLPENSPCLSK